MNDRIKIVRQYRKNGDIIVEIMKGNNPSVEILNLGTYPDGIPDSTLYVSDRHGKPYTVKFAKGKATSVEVVNTY